MSLQAKTFLNLLAGGLAGLLAWVLTDLTGWFSNIFQPHYVIRGGLFGDPKFLLYGAIFGTLLGLLLALVDAINVASFRQVQRLLMLSSLIGFIGGWFGLAFGQTVWNLIITIFHVDPESINLTPGNFFVLLFGRAAGYSVIGCIVGAAQGVVSRSPVIARQGAFGGLLGGFLGGVSFEILNGLNIFTGLSTSSGLSRLVALVAVGALAGFFVGVVQNLFKQTWIRVVLGRNEGKEYLITKPITTIGRSELADIGLYGDPSIAPTHAALEALPAQNRHRLRAVMESGKRGTEYVPPLVNGQPVTGEQWLADGDTIQIGTRTLLFQEKATRKGRSVPPPTPGPSPVPVGAGTAASRYVGEELAAASNGAPARPSLTTPDDVIAQMGTVPTAEATILSGPGFGGLGTRLICVQGPYTGQSFPLSHTPVTIGRAPDRTIALPADTSISRTHALVTYADSRHLIADDGSSNGTFVNGQRVTDPRPLSSGDLIQVAETALRYE